MQTLGMKFQEPKHPHDNQQSPHQPTLPLEVFLEEAGTPPGGAQGPPRTPRADVAPSRTCRPDGVWETLAKTDRERVKSSWARTMREVADDACNE